MLHSFSTGALRLLIIVRETTEAMSISHTSTLALVAQALKGFFNCIVFG